MKLYQGLLPTSSTSLWVADRKVTEYTIVAANETASSASFRIYHCYAGAVGDTSNIVVPDVAVDGNQVLVINLPLRLNPGDLLRGLQATTNAVCVTIDGDDGAG